MLSWHVVAFETNIKRESGIRIAAQGHADLANPLCAGSLATKYEELTIGSYSQH